MPRTGSRQVRTTVKIKNMATTPCYLVIELQHEHVYTVTRAAQLVMRLVRRLREHGRHGTVFTNAAGRRTLRDLGLQRAYLVVPADWSLARATDEQRDTICLQWCAADSVMLGVHGMGHPRLDRVLEGSHLAGAD